MRALRAARLFIYLENQFLWSPEIVDALPDKLIHPPTPGFRLVVLLPSRPNSGKDDTLGQLGVLAEADERGERFLACALHPRTRGLAPVYVHAKVGIVDDAWLTVGSGNLNDHSLFNDTEVNVVVRDPRLAREARLRLWSEHLEMQPDELQGDPPELSTRIGGRSPPSRRRCADAGEAMTHRLARLPHVSEAARRLLGPLDGMVFDG